MTIFFTRTHTHTHTHTRTHARTHARKLTSCRSGSVSRFVKSHVDNKYVHVVDIRLVQNYFRERGGVVVGRLTPNRGPGFDPHRRHRVVSMSKTQ